MIDDTFQIDVGLIMDPAGDIDDYIKYMINGASQTDIIKMHTKNDVVLSKDPAGEIEDFINHMINGASQTDEALIVMHQSGATEGEYRQRLSSETEIEEALVPQRAPIRFMNKERTYSW